MTDEIGYKKSFSKRWSLWLVSVSASRSLVTRIHDDHRQPMAYRYHFKLRFGWGSTIKWEDGGFNAHLGAEWVRPLRGEHSIPLEDYDEKHAFVRSAAWKAEEAARKEWERGRAS